MEIESFQDPTFNAIEWINSSFKNSEKKENKEVFVTNVVTKLQLYVQQVNSALEGTSQQVLAALPKIIKDANNLQHDAQLMRTKMSEIQTNIAEVQRKTGACMGRLEHLDALKTKLQISKEGLQESDGWGHLTTELEDLLEHKDITKACEKLQSLQKSLVAQAGLPGQMDRQTQMDGFKNRIEALISPEVIESFSLGNIEQSKKHVEIYAIMERIPNLTYYYRTVTKDALQKQWMESIELAKHTASFSFLREFYDFVLDHWKRQQKWCSNVFGTYALNEPTIVLIELFQRLQPSRETAITDCLKVCDDKLKTLEEFSMATNYFGTIMQKNIGEMVNSGEQQQQLAHKIFDYFLAFIPIYMDIERTELCGKIDELDIIQATAIQTIRNFGNANSKLFKWSEEFLRRCNSITQNVGLISLITVLNQIFKTFLDKYKKAQKQLHAQRGNAQNWNLVQNCISLLQHIGNFQMQLNEFETFVSDKMFTKEQELQNATVHFGYTFIDSDWKIFQKLIQQIKDNKTTTTTGNENNIFAAVFKEIKPICEYIHDTLTSAVFQPIQHHMSQQVIATVGQSDDNDDDSGGGGGNGGVGSNLPDYSFAPQEVITQIGQYLLTLPQHLEPLLLSPSQQLKTALKECDSNYEKNQSSLDILLALIVDECCQLYEEKIMQTSELNGANAKQLATDIDYLGSVLDELGLSLGERLQQISTLLRATPETYLSASAGFDPILVTSIRQIRNIVSIE